MTVKEMIEILKKYPDDLKVMLDDNCILVKSDNYMNFILPLIQSFI